MDAENKMKKYGTDPAETRRKMMITIRLSFIFNNESLISKLGKSGPKVFSQVVEAKAQK